MAKHYRIGELAAQLSTSVETLRYYEKEGLLPRAARSEANYRLYSEAQRERLAFILHCRTLDMTHEEIRRLLSLRDHPEQGCSDVNALLDEHIGHVTERIRALQSLQAELRRLRSRCQAPGSSKTCGILEELAVAPEAGRAPRKAGVHARQASSG